MSASKPPISPSPVIASVEPSTGHFMLLPQIPLVAPTPCISPSLQCQVAAPRQVLEMPSLMAFAWAMVPAKYTSVSAEQYSNALCSMLISPSGRYISFSSALLLNG